MKIAKETWVLLSLGIADLVTTIIFIRQNGAAEANPLFSRYWEMGASAFIAAKLIMLACPLLVLEWARKRNPRFVTFALRGAIAGYVLMYGAGYMHLNGKSAFQDELARTYVAPTPQFLHYTELLEENLDGRRHGPILQHEAVATIR